MCVPKTRPGMLSRLFARPDSISRGAFRPSRDHLEPDLELDPKSRDQRERFVHNAGASDPVTDALGALGTGLFAGSR